MKAKPVNRTKKTAVVKKPTKGAQFADYLEATGFLHFIEENIREGGSSGDDASEVFPDYHAELEFYLRDRPYRSADDEDAPDKGARGDFQDDFEAIGVTSREQFDEFAEKLPDTVLGVLRGQIEGREGSTQQRACVLMLGWQLGCDRTEWKGGPQEFFSCYSGERNPQLEDVIKAYRIACDVLGMDTSYV